MNDSAVNLAHKYCALRGFPLRLIQGLMVVRTSQYLDTTFAIIEVLDHEEMFH